MALADFDPPIEDAPSPRLAADPASAAGVCDPAVAAAGGRFARRKDDPSAAAAAAGGRFVRPGGDREEAAVAASVPGGPEPLAVTPPSPSARDAESRRAARARQAVVARWLRQLSR
jgi:hypothetical protein